MSVVALLTGAGVCCRGTGPCSQHAGWGHVPTLAAESQAVLQKGYVRACVCVRVRSRELKQTRPNVEHAGTWVVADWYLRCYSCSLLKVWEMRLRERVLCSKPRKEGL